MNENIKTSIRFFDDVPVRSVWDDETSKWRFCASDVVKALIRRNFELFTNCKQLELSAADGKKYATDVIE